MTEPGSREVERARRLLAEARRVVVLTGAGVSAESGVPTFRGADGLWKRHRPEELATPQAFARDPRLVWEWYGWRRELLAPCAPNPAHRALARWMGRHGGVTLVTQNVDGLHEIAAREAGVRADPLRLHGSIFHVRCTRCDHRAEHREPIDATAPGTLPRCPACGALLRPDVVWFGEVLPERELLAAFGAATMADACLVVGTSGQVYPAAAVAHAAADRGARLVVVDPQVTAFDGTAEACCRGTASTIVPVLVGE